MPSAPLERSSSQVVISKPCMGAQLRALSTRMSSVPLTSGKASGMFLQGLYIDSGWRKTVAALDGRAKDKGERRRRKDKGGKTRAGRQGREGTGGMTTAGRS